MNKCPGKKLKNLKSTLGTSSNHYSKYVFLHLLQEQCEIYVGLKMMMTKRFSTFVIPEAMIKFSSFGSVCEPTFTCFFSFIKYS